MAESSDSDANRVSNQRTRAEIDERMAQIDGINGAAGHRIDDPNVRNVLRRQIAGEITGDEARDLMRVHCGRA